MTTAALKSSTVDPTAMLKLEAEKAAAIKLNDTRKADFFVNVEVLGEMAGASAGSIFTLALAFQQGIRDKFLTVLEARAVYDHYATGFKRTLISSTGTEAMSEASIAAQTSILKTFGQTAAVEIGEEIYQRVIELRKTIASEDRTGSAYSNFAAVNRKLQALAKDYPDFASLKAAVTDEILVSWISKATPVAKDAEAKLRAFIEAGMKLAKVELAGSGEFAAVMEKLKVIEAALKVGTAPVAEIVKKAA